MRLQIKVRGEAEAFAIAAKSKAEAEQMAKKAEAWREYREAAMVDMLLDTLPKVGTAVGFASFQNANSRIPPNSSGRLRQKWRHHCRRRRKSRWYRAATVRSVP